MKKLSGPLAILCSAVFFGSYGIWSKLMADSMNPFFQGWTRSLMMLAVLIPVGMMTRSFKRYTADELRWVAAFSVPGALVIPVLFYGFTRLPIGTATLAFYAALTVTGYAVGYGVFREKITPVKIVSLVLGILGLLAVGASTVSVSLSLILPLLATVLAGICGGIEVTLTKKLSGNHSPLQLTATLFTVSLLQCLAVDLVRTGGHPVFVSGIVPWVGNIGHAVASIFAFTLVVVGYRKTESSIGSVIGLMEIPFGIAFGWVLFHEAPTVATFVGMTCIILAGILPLQKSQSV